MKVQRLTVETMIREKFNNSMRSWLSKIIELAKNQERLKITSTHVIIEHNTDTSIRHSRKNDDIVRTTSNKEDVEYQDKELDS